MTTRRKKTAEGDEWSITLSKKNTTLIVIGFLFFASGNPFLQKAGSALLGVASPVSNIEEIKDATTANTMHVAELAKQTKEIDKKVDGLVVEVERLQMRTVK